MKKIGMRSYLALKAGGFDSPLINKLVLIDKCGTLSSTKNAWDPIQAESRSGTGPGLSAAGARVPSLH